MAAAVISTITGGKHGPASQLWAHARSSVWCRDQGCGRTDPNPGPDYAMRTEFGRPRSSMRLSTWPATSTSVARRSSVRERNLSPITRLNRLIAVSARARVVYPDAFCTPCGPSRQ